MLRETHVETNMLATWIGARAGELDDGGRLTLWGEGYARLELVEHGDEQLHGEGSSGMARAQAETGAGRQQDSRPRQQM
jgi:hypothetical protein